MAATVALNMHQPPMTVDDQISNLIQKGLIINDEEFARSFLNDVSYFRLIKAYSLGLKAKNGKYHKNVHFEDLVNLYLFNANLRQQLFAEIERVEVNLRCRLANYFCEKYGVFGYEDINNFNVTAKVHKAFLGEIKREIKRNSKSPFVRNFLDNYNVPKIPLYALVELMSFGTLSKLYKNMKNEDKKAVAALFNAKYVYFESWVESIAYVRNFCAHYGRLYNSRLVKTPKLYKQYKVANNRVFATILTLKHILPNDQHWRDFIMSIESLLVEYPNVNLSYIGFPNNWKDYMQ